MGTEQTGSYEYPPAQAALEARQEIGIPGQGQLDQLKTSLTSLQREVTDLSGVVASLAESVAKLNNWADQEVVRKFQEHQAIMEEIDRKQNLQEKAVCRLESIKDVVAGHVHNETGQAQVPAGLAMEL